MGKMSDMNAFVVVNYSTCKSETAPDSGILEAQVDRGRGQIEPRLAAIF